MRVHKYVIGHRLKTRKSTLLLFAAFLVVVGGAMYTLWWSNNTPSGMNYLQNQLPALAPKAGDVLGEDDIKLYTPEETTALAKENYGGATLPITTGITKIIFHYRSELPGGEPITVYGRAYLPETPAKNLPIFAFAPGTTGIGDKCAASLEQPKVSNWANYDSHMAMYASQGYAAVITDYEGMRDPNRIHHYMVGELEGRAVLDSVRALRRLSESKGRLDQSQVFLGGYSQGGHAAFWADKIAASYAPDVKPLGVVGFGPVMSVKETLTDVVHAANINWFGPYVAYSYDDYYSANFSTILLPHWKDTLATDVPAHCIDTDLPFWGHNPANVYTPEFIQAATNGTMAQLFPDFNKDLDLNEVGTDSTSSAKLINEGAEDNVVLPAQQTAEVPKLCQSSAGPVALKVYPNTTHYSAMVHGLADTLAWMKLLSNGGKPAATCSPSSTAVPTLTPTPTPTPTPSTEPTPAPTS
jgi:hypothetical protein